MRPIHARYPFLEAARAAAESADVAMAEIVRDQSSPVRERARERIDETITDGRVADPGRDPYVEVLSYPLARVLVSLVDDPALTARYAEAEAERAYQLFSEELRDEADLQSVHQARLTLSTILTEFDLVDHVTADHDGYRIAVAAFLRLATELRAGRWRLVNRALTDGEIPLTEAELFTLLREAVRRQVADGLPLTVPEEIAALLADEVERIEAALADVTVPSDLERVEPAAFPPCMVALIDRLEAGAELPPHSQFALVSFLAGSGMDATDIAARFGDWLDPAAIERQFDALHGEARGNAYPPPGCATMQAYGDCVNMDQLCHRIEHPMEYYAERLAGADDPPLTSR